ncbi:MAG: porin [Rhodocyclales bacterium]|nr:porin [Rhodocyclales bacterium]
MQKKIIALAIAGLSSAAFAQTNVTIQGLFDTGYQNFSAENAGVTTKTNRWGSASNTATTNFTFVVNEDLGGGMKAGLWLESDPTTPGSAGASGVWNSQNYLFLSGNFGKVSLGFMNNYALTSALTSQPFGVGMGGGYSGAFGRLNGVNVIGAPTAVAAATNAAAGSFAGARDIRANNSIKYDTPNWSGFSAGLLYRSPNSGGGNVAADADGQTQVGLNYNNGPLNVSYAHSNILSNVAGLNTGVTTHNLLGANYTFGTFTLMAGWTSSKNNANPKTLDARSWNVAAKWQATPTLAVMANVLKSDDKLAANQDRNLNALGLDYSMSKRTTAYVRWEGGDNDKSAATGFNSGKFNRTALGFRHSF